MVPDADNVTRWIVDQQFRETQIQLGIPLGGFLHTDNMLVRLRASLAESSAFDADYCDRCF